MTARDLKIDNTTTGTLNGWVRLCVAAGWVSDTLEGWKTAVLLTVRDGRVAEADAMRWLDTVLA